MRFLRTLLDVSSYLTPAGELTREDARVAAYRIVQNIKGNYREAIRRETRGMTDAQVQLVLEECEHLIVGCKISSGRKVS